MKMHFNLYFLGILALMIVAGCATTQELGTSIKSKVSSITSTVDPALVNQVPADKREGFSKAEYDLNVANAKVLLAGLKRELAASQKNYADLEEDLANNVQKEAEIDHDTVRISAIINSGLGKKEDNNKIKTNLQAKKLEVQAARIKINGHLESNKEKINALTAEVAKAEEGIKAMKFESGKISDKSVAVPAAADKKP
jgi:hypothetical protein